MPNAQNQFLKLVRRSKLFVPVNRDNFVAKAWTRGADCIILELEDAITPSDKASARKLVKDVIPVVNKGGAEVQVRFNRDSEEEDLDAIVITGLDEWVATAEQIGPKLAQVFLTITDNPLLIMFMINALILLLGFPLEPLPMIMMLIPVLMPVVKQLRIEPVHFIVVFTVNIQLALLTPPVGANLFVVTAISKSTILEVSRALIPFLIALLAALVILIVYPPLTLWLPKALMG